MTRKGWEQRLECMRNHPRVDPKKLKRVEKIYGILIRLRRI